ncbi:hypothetical protein U9M48_043942 [Paspalum notatum var. saurae]|uniref:Uncharacterized protein n=1 Tax=Paspalum notatum var. saurae TaxID=547442 RepID=A0AAQ3UXZ0_PASNO
MGHDQRARGAARATESGCVRPPWRVWLPKCHNINDLDAPGQVIPANSPKFVMRPDTITSLLPWDSEI